MVLKRRARLPGQAKKQKTKNGKKSRPENKSWVGRKLNPCEHDYLRSTREVVSTAPWTNLFFSEILLLFVEKLFVVNVLLSSLGIAQEFLTGCPRIGHDLLR